MLATFSRVLFFVAATVLLGGCDTSGLLRNGIGETVYVPGETEERIHDAQTYFAEMCVRTGHCERVKIKEIVWTSFNDVDERCASYLNSLDAARRDKRYWNKMWTDMGPSAKNIVGLTNPGVKALTILEAAFYFVKSSVNEYYSAVIMSEEPSMVARIVGKLQTQYRSKLDELLASQSIDMTGAHYVVRGYLRLCLPVTIESELKSIKANVAYDASGVRSSLPRATPVLEVLDAFPEFAALNGPGGHPGGPGTADPGSGQPGTRPEPSPLSDQMILNGLCVTSGSREEFEKAIRQFREAGISPEGPSPFELTKKEHDQIAAKSKVSCGGPNYRNVFERFAFDEEPKIKGLHLLLAEASNKLGLGQPVFGNAQEIGTPTREVIRKIRDCLQLTPGYDGMDNALMRILDRPPSQCSS